MRICWEICGPEVTSWVVWHVTLSHCHITYSSGETSSPKFQERVSGTYFRNISGTFQEHVSGHLFPIFQVPISGNRFQEQISQSFRIPVSETSGTCSWNLFFEIGSWNVPEICSWNTFLELWGTCLPRTVCDVTVWQCDMSHNPRCYFRTTNFPTYSHGGNCTGFLNFPYNFYRKKTVKGKFNFHQHFGRSQNMRMKSLNNHDNPLHCEHVNGICSFICIFNIIFQPWNSCCAPCESPLALLVPKSTTIHSSRSSDPGRVCKITSPSSRDWTADDLLNATVLYSIVGGWARVCFCQANKMHLFALILGELYYSRKWGRCNQ